MERIKFELIDGGAGGFCLAVSNRDQSTCEVIGGVDPLNGAPTVKTFIVDVDKLEKLIQENKYDPNTANQLQRR